MKIARDLRDQRYLADDDLQKYVNPSLSRRECASVSVLDIRPKQRPRGAARWMSWPTAHQRVARRDAADTVVPDREAPSGMDQGGCG